MSDSRSEVSVLLSVRPSVSTVCPVSSDALEPSGLVSPSSTVRSLTKELQHSLDLASATSGDKVVTAQVSKVHIQIVGTGHEGRQGDVCLSVSDVSGK